MRSRAERHGTLGGDGRSGRDREPSRHGERTRSRSGEVLCWIRMCDGLVGWGRSYALNEPESEHGA